MLHVACVVVNEDDLLVVSALLLTLICSLRASFTANLYRVVTARDSFLQELVHRCRDFSIVLLIIFLGLS
jgi:hypothetical protein